jgi:hypothetical protein
MECISRCDIEPLQQACAPDLAPVLLRVASDRMHARAAPPAGACAAGAAAAAPQRRGTPFRLGIVTSRRQESFGGRWCCSGGGNGGGSGSWGIGSGLSSTPISQRLPVVSTTPAGIPEAVWLSCPAAVRALILAQQREIQAHRQENDELRGQLTALASELAQLQERIGRSSRNSS